MNIEAPQSSKTTRSVGNIGVPEFTAGLAMKEGERIDAEGVEIKRVPEILAPAGGRAQFFAALRVGADAVYLGLKDFNARARADNFTIEDLQELIPIARHYGMKVLVTFNVLVKNSELERAIATLAALERVGVDAIIVQDLAVIRLARNFFPGLRLHASTQMAIHNLSGVEQAAEIGIKRAVLARELTANEVKRIRAAVPREQMELEVFCHGSLCYSYSGLCFFSGAADARSGNRGECAYTCRQPYKILSEPGNGFLFSMRDLDTSRQLASLIEAGVDCLKIEGRKKDAQYVASVTRLYREKLDQLFARSTVRPLVKELVQSSQSGGQDEESIRSDLGMTFQRRSTTFFVKGRYVENVIDLDNPGHLGSLVGTVEGVHDDCILTNPSVMLERFDGIRIDSPKRLYQAQPQGDLSSEPQHLQDLNQRYHNEVCQFSLREMYDAGRGKMNSESLSSVPVAKIGRPLLIKIPSDLPTPKVGDLLYRTRSSALKGRVDALSRPPEEQRIRPLEPISLEVALNWNSATNEPTEINFRIEAKRFGAVVTTFELQFPAEHSRGLPLLQADINQVFSIFGDEKFGVESLSCSLPEQGSPFIPKSKLKEIKRAFAATLRQNMDVFFAERLTDATTGLTLAEPPCKPFEQGDREFQIKIDRLEYLPHIEAIVASLPNHGIREVLFEPKRAFLGTIPDLTLITELQSFERRTGIALRLSVPTVLRAWDLPLIGKLFEKGIELGLTRIEVGNLGALKLCKDWNTSGALLDLTGDFTLYSLNHQASGFWQEQGLRAVALSIEDDFENICAHMAQFPKNLTAHAIIYKDTPLFVAEACSLTALHNGCPSSSVCGYRTLEVANEKGERFFVAHESCKSIVYGDQAYSVAHEQAAFLQLGIKAFRMDFLTRPYKREDIESIFKAAFTMEAVPNTHSANFRGRLL